MPTYEFRCPVGHECEKFYRKMSEAPTSVECPTCGALAERRVSGGAGLLFKGQGFYITDYGKDGKKDQRAAAAKNNEAKKPESSAPESSSGKDSSAPDTQKKGGGDTSSGSGGASTKRDSKPE
jgi:putative FmdB family regulatory protein